MAKQKTAAFKKIEGIVGEDKVSADEKLLASYTEAGLSSGGNPLRVVKPSSTEDVQELIKLARKEKINLVFSSSSSPRFRGDTVPAGEGIIVDMSGMRKVIRIDKRNKVALIEPGVTFPELAAEVEHQGMKVLMPLLPRLGKSVLASYLEREPIQIPKYHWDMTDPLLCTELVFGTGDLFRTGSAAGPGTLEQQWAAGSAQKNPMGPAQTDFARIVQGSQGTMAAVTWASVKLELQPSIHKLYFVPCDNLSRLVDFAYRALRPKLGDEFFILNARSLANIIANKPQEIEPLQSRQAPYTLVYGVSGYEYVPEKRVAYQENDLQKISGETGVKIVQDIPGCSSERLETIIANCSRTPYYKTMPRGAFLDIFFLTTLDKVSSFIEVMEEVAKKHSYDKEHLGIYIQPIQHGRTAHLEFSLYYNPENEKDTERVKQLFAEASKALSGAGAFFSRPYGMWADLAYERCPDTVSALRKIKNMLDPDGILNRDKLCFGEVK